jgi:hypothetical protein
MNKSSKIFIFGSSWRFCYNCSEVEGKYKSLADYFIDMGYRVISHGERGMSNFTIIGIMKQVLDTDFIPGDVVLWIKSDPIVDILAPQYSLTNEIKSAGGLYQLHVRISRDSYSRLQAISSTHGTIINAIGGSSDLFLSELTDFPGINPVVPSWVHLLVGHFIEYQELFPHIQTKLYGINNIDLNAYDFEFRQQVVHELWEISRGDIMYREAIFQPDGWHPNCQGHKILFDKILSQLNIEIS